MFYHRVSHENKGGVLPFPAVVREIIARPLIKATGLNLIIYLTFSAYCELVEFQPWSSEAPRVSC